MTASYARDGFTIVPRCISEADLDQVAADIAGILARRVRVLGYEAPAGSGQPSITQLLSTLFGAGTAHYIAAAKLTQHLPSVHRLGLSVEITTAVQAAGFAVPTISTRPVIHYMGDRLKIEGGYHKTPIHQDWRSVQGSLDGVTLWIPLFDVSEVDYPLEVIPGSHLGGLLPSTDDAFGHRVADGVVDESAFVPLKLHRGDVVLFSGFLVHRTGARGGDAVRVALSYRFNNAADPTFVARGYPDRYVYRPDMELLDPTFPPPGEVAAFFGRAPSTAKDAVV